MGMNTQWVRFGENEAYSGYFAAPDRTDGQTLPAVIVIQEIWGVNDHIQDVTRRFAAAGYAAFAPELFRSNGEYRSGLDPQSIKLLLSARDSIPPSDWQNQEARDQALSVYSEDERKLIENTQKTLFSGHPTDEYLRYLSALVMYIQNNQPLTSGSKIAAVGYCLGGALTAQLACKNKALAAGVIYYGNAPKAEDLESLSCPLLGFYGELDTRLVEQLPAFSDITTKLGKSFDYVVYPNAPHAFFNDMRPSYKPDAARDSFAKTLTFLNHSLSS